MLMTLVNSERTDPTKMRPVRKSCHDFGATLRFTGQSLTGTAFHPPPCKPSLTHPECCSSDT